MCNCNKKRRCNCSSCCSGANNSSDLNFILKKIINLEEDFDNLDLLQLGETSCTAYRGDRGKVAYDHSKTTGNPHKTKIEDIPNLNTILSTLALKEYVDESIENISLTPGPEGPEGPQGPPGDDATNYITSVNGQTGEVVITPESIGLGTVFIPRQSVETPEDLPMTGNKVGDVRNVNSTGDNYVWTEEGTWDKLAGDTATVQAGSGLHLGEDGELNLGLDLETGKGNLNKPLYLILGDLSSKNSGFGISEEAGNQSLYLYTTDGGKTSSLELHKDTIFFYKQDAQNLMQSLYFKEDGVIELMDAVHSKGLVYGEDYSENFTDLSLVTKKWVEDNFGGEEVDLSQYIKKDIVNILDNDSGELVFTDLDEWGELKISPYKIESSNQENNDGFSISRFGVHGSNNSGTSIEESYIFTPHDFRVENNKNFSLKFYFGRPGRSVLSYPITGQVERTLAISVNGQYADYEGNIEISTQSSPSPFEAVSGTGTIKGIALTGRDATSYGPIGLNAIDFGFVDSGGSNSLYGATGEYSMVSGGRRNIASGNQSVVNGGIGNTALGTSSTIGGGSFNETVRESSTVSGGTHNKALVYGSTIGGGMNNEAKGNNSTVTGGANNKALGSFSIVLGGANNSASSDYSIVGGFNNSAPHYSSLVIGRHSLEDNVEDIWFDGSPIFRVGNGVNGDNRSDSYTLYNDGRSKQNKDIEVEGIGQGVVLKSPDGSKWRLTPDNDGQPVFTKL